MSYRDSVPYTDCDDNIVEHARWVVAQMGPSRNDLVDIQIHDCYDRNDSNNSNNSDDSDDSDDIGVKCLFRRIHENWWSMKLKYIRQKSGGGCGSGKRFVPVSCSKDCSKCHGCSPGCGKNYEFEKIDGFSLNSETWKSLRNRFDKNQEKDYIDYHY